MVDQGHQRKGFGSEAIEQLVRYVREKHGLTEFYTNVDPDNRAAMRLFQKLGFKKTGGVVWEESLLKREL
jgi:RimJ/RimL family protein N-acetyltransferase